MSLQLSPSADHVAKRLCFGVSLQSLQDNEVSWDKEEDSKSVHSKDGPDNDNGIGMVLESDEGNDDSIVAVSDDKDNEVNTNTNSIGAISDHDTGCNSLIVISDSEDENTAGCASDDADANVDKGKDEEEDEEDAVGGVSNNTDDDDNVLCDSVQLPAETSQATSGAGPTSDNDQSDKREPVSTTTRTGGISS